MGLKIDTEINPQFNAKAQPQAKGPEGPVLEIPSEAELEKIVQTAYPGRAFMFADPDNLPKDPAAREALLQKRIDQLHLKVTPQFVMDKITENSTGVIQNAEYVEVEDTSGYPAGLIVNGHHSPDIRGAIRGSTALAPGMIAENNNLTGDELHAIFTYHEAGHAIANAPRDLLGLAKKFPDMVFNRELFGQHYEEMHADIYAALKSMQKLGSDRVAKTLSDVRAYNQIQTNMSYFNTTAMDRTIDYGNKNMAALRGMNEEQLQNLAASLTKKEMTIELEQCNGNQFAHPAGALYESLRDAKRNAPGANIVDKLFTAQTEGILDYNNPEIRRIVDAVSNLTGSQMIFTANTADAAPAPQAAPAAPKP